MRLQTIEELIIERDRLIAEHPSLKAFQKEIDMKLLHLKDPMDRLQVIADMSRQKAKELENAMKELYTLMTGEKI